MIATAQKAIGTAQGVVAAVKRAQDMLKNGDPKDVVAQAAKDAGLLNTASSFATKQFDRQLAFFKDRDEVKKVEGWLGETKLMRAALPNIPKLPNAEE